MKLLPPTKIYVTQSKIKNAGRGVFASQDISKGEIIEVCPTLEIPNNDIFNLSESILANYYFSFDELEGMVYIVLGFGSLFNHSYEPNATYKNIPKDKLVEFQTIRNIKKDEEITIDYNYGDNSPLWRDIPHLTTKD